MRLSPSRGVLASLAIACSAALFPVHAQGWFPLPNGGLGYMTDYTTSGLFTCQPRYYPGGSCYAAGNTMTLTTGSASLTLTFRGVTRTVRATTTGGPQAVELGTIEKTLSGSGPFEFPYLRDVQSPFFRFALGVTTPGPTGAFGSRSYGYMLRSTSRAFPNCCGSGGSKGFSVPIPEAPGPYDRDGLYFYDITDPVFTVDEAPLVISGMATVTPEPATLLLVGSALVGFVGFASRSLRWRR